MNEITKIHLGRQAFTISVEAHKALQAYLHEIKHQVGDKGKDVIDEVELRMAELLAERGVHGDKVVLPDDVTYLKEQLGSPRDFKDDDDTATGNKEQAPADATTPKRLFRDTQNGLLAGVCAGLAKFFGIDVTIVRLIFLALLFFGGGGVLLYIVLWLIVPEAKTTSEQLQMQGKPVTVDSLKQVVDRADVQGAARRAHHAVAPAVQLTAKIFLGVIGVLFITIAASMLIGVTTAVVYSWTNNGIHLAGEKLFPIGTKETLLLMSALITAAVISLFFLFSGIAMVNRKWKIPGWVAGALGGIFLLGIATTTALSFVSAPQLQQRFDDMHHVASMDVQPFKRVVLDGKDARYIYEPDTAYKIEYRYLGKQPVANFVKDIKDDTLTLDTRNLRKDSCDLFCNYNERDLTVTIHAPSLDNVVLNGENASFTNLKPLKQTGLSLTATRDTHIDLHYINPQKLTFSSSPDQETMTLVLNGLRTEAFESDVVGGYGGFLTISRATAVELSTNAQCTPDDAIIDLLSYPDKLAINGKAFTSKGDLQSQQNVETPGPDNCAIVH
ncbi:MAG TPA: PspC domain-containing protein [Patescibacteria group bacterium]|nr:PspC domain-containing protein [Patescibacteria group bacterium]